MVVSALDASAKKYPSIYHDDGITEPYVPPKLQTDYMKKVPKEYLKYFWAKPEMVEQWQDWKFGVFMHWDPSCQLTGSVSWARKGPRPHHSSDGKVTRGIPEKIYNSQYKTFNPVEFDADKFIKMIKDAGAQYFVFTAKHHNGFCMFDTPTTDYCIRSTPFKRDICGELAAACHKYGIKLFWYYSQPDWTEPTYRYEFGSQEFIDKYLHGYLYPQLKQLMTKYGKVDGIWFDGLGQAPETWDAPEMLKMLRTINPDLIVNHRFGRPQMRLGEFDGPENKIGRFQTNRPWETCYCIGGPWGYSPKATPLTKRDAIGLLVRCAGNGGNLLLNTGPSPKGTIHPEHIERYLDMGRWLNKYGESVYATRGGPYMPGPWGCATRGKDNNYVYLHILGDWPGYLDLADIGAEVVAAKNLTGPGEVNVERKNGRLVVSLMDFDKSKQSKIDTIIRLKMDRKASALPVVKSVGDSLTVGAKVKASSSGDSGHKPTRPEAVIATSAKEAHDGAYVRAVWQTEGSDKKPWLEIDFGKPAVVQQVAIQEGRYGRVGTVEGFTISLRSEGKWQEVYQGKEIGSSFGVVLDKPVKADAIRLDFTKFKRHVTLNAVNVYR
jgi:alpha-L-fucosidase